MQKNPQFVFIVGCPHSGTTILHRLFSLHRSVLGVPGESGLFLSKPTEAKISGTLSHWRSLANEEQKTHVVEKTPWHGLKINIIAEAVADAKFVFILRNPVDTYGSLKHRGATNRIPDSCEGRIGIIAEFLGAALQAQAYLMTLENLTQNPAVELANALGASGIPCTASEAADIVSSQTAAAATAAASSQPADRKDGAAHRELRAWQVNQPIFADTRNRQNVMPTETQQVMADLSPLVRELSKKLDLAGWTNDFPLR
jgi:hypothetical protein